MSGENKTRIAAIADLHIRDTDKGKWIDFFLTFREMPMCLPFVAISQIRAMNRKPISWSMN